MLDEQIDIATTIELRKSLHGLAKYRHRIIREPLKLY